MLFAEDHVHALLLLLLLRHRGLPRRHVEGLGLEGEVQATGPLLLQPHQRRHHHEASLTCAAFLAFREGHHDGIALAAIGLLREGTPVLPDVIFLELIGGAVAGHLRAEVAEASDPGRGRCSEEQVVPLRDRPARQLVEHDLPVPVRPQHGIGDDLQDAFRLHRGLRGVDRRLLRNLERLLDLLCQLLHGGKARRLSFKLLLGRFHARDELLTLREDVVGNELRKLQAEGLTMRSLGPLEEHLSLLFGLPDLGADIVVAQEHRVDGRRRWQHRALGRLLAIGVVVYELDAREQVALREQQRPVV
mmetsp:Transcript_159100/g.510254  ORF Transcript_159100/g.510254 Transcript_159100/m.510254 type:complete len:304 (+) Transcript_159100:301-1212(+)